MGAFLPPKALHGLMSNSSLRQVFLFLPPPPLMVKVSTAPRSYRGEMRDVSPRLEERAGQASIRVLRARCLSSANCPLPPSIYFLRSLRFARPSVPPHYPDGALPELPASPNSASSQRRSLPPSLPPRRVGPIYGNLVEGAAAAGPFLEVIVGKQETAVDAAGRLVNAGK